MERLPSQSLRDSSPGGRATGEGEPLRIASPLRRGGSASAESERFFAGEVVERPPSQSLRDSSPGGRATGEGEPRVRESHSGRRGGMRSVRERFLNVIYKKIK